MGRWGRVSDPSDLFPMTASRFVRRLGACGFRFHGPRRDELHIPGFYVRLRRGETETLDVEVERKDGRAPSQALSVLLSGASLRLRWTRSWSGYPQ
jgi:hypothetical protein